MASIEQIARVTTRGKSLDNATDGSVRSNAFITFTKLHNLIKESGTPVEEWHAVSGLKAERGFLWKGALSHVIRDLWPTSTKDDDLGHEINRFLSATHNAVCVKRHADTQPPTWWVRDEWAERPAVKLGALSPTVYPTATERKVTPHEAGEDRLAAPVTVTFKEPAIPEPATEPARTAAAPVPTPIAVTEVKRQRAEARTATMVRNRPAFVVSSDGEPVPPDFPHACGLTNPSGVRCRRVFRAPQSASLHRNAGHKTINALLEAAADLVAAGTTLTTANVTEPAGLHCTTVYSFFPTLNDLYYEARLLVERRAVAARRTQAARDRKAEKHEEKLRLEAEKRTVAREVELSEAAKWDELARATRLDAEARTREIYQLFVGFAHAVGAPFNLSSLDAIPVPVVQKKRRQLVDEMWQKKIFARQASLDAVGRPTHLLVPGIAFDEGIARRLDALRAPAAPVDPGTVTPEAAEKLDLLALLELAADEIRSQREIEKTAAVQDELLVQLAKDRDDALHLAEEAVTEAGRAHDEAVEAKKQLAAVQKTLDHFRKVLGASDAG